MPSCFHTPRTVLTWATLGEWLACAQDRPPPRQRLA